MPIYVSDDIVLKDNTISTAQSNANVQIVPNGSGALQIDGINIAGNVITTNSSNANLEFKANSSGVVFVNDSFKIGTGATVTTILDEDDLSSDSATSLATQQSVKAYVDAQLTASDLDFQGDSGGALSIDLDSETLDIAGGANITTTGSGNTLTVALDAALTGLTSVTVDGITISDNIITTNASNANLELDANSSGYVKVLGTGALGVPVGTTGQRPTAVTGQLRLNSTTGNFEGYDGTSWGSLAGSSSASEDTSNTTKVTLGQIGATATIVDSFGVSAFQTVKYNYVVNDEINGEFQTGFIHLVHDSSDSYISEYAITHTGSSAFATFSTDISGSTVRLKLTGTSTTNSVTLFRTGLGSNSEADASSTNTGLTLNSDVDSAQESLDTTTASTYRGVQYFILASQTAGDGSTVGHECIKINAVHDGSTVYHTAFGRTSTTGADLMTYDVDINSGNIRLLGTGATANTSVKIYKIMVQDTEESSTGDNVSVITNTDVDSAIENVDTWENSLTAGTTYQAAHYFNTVKAPAGVGGAEYQVSEIVVVADGGDNVFESEFGIVHSGNRQLISYSTDYNNTTARLRGVGATVNLVVNGYRVNMERKGLGVSAASVVLNTNDQSIQGLKTFTSGIATDDITSPSSNADINIDPAGTGAVNILSSATITTTTTDDSLTITTTEASSTAAPVISLKRNSSSPADADYLGQIKFKGENDADQEIVYAKITGKILDASDGSEDGIIEFAHKKAGSNVITGRFRSDSLQLLNDTNLRVSGVTELGIQSGDPSTTANFAKIYAKDESSSAEMFVQDEAGNVTKISPHNEQGEWEYYSRNTKTGKTVRVNMEEMIRDIEKLTGKTYIQSK